MQPDGVGLHPLLLRLPRRRPFGRASTAGDHYGPRMKISSRVEAGSFITAKSLDFVLEHI